MLRMTSWERGGQSLKIVLSCVVTAAMAFALWYNVWPPVRPAGARVFRIGFQHSPPHQYVTKSGDPSGPAIEIISEACRRPGVTIRWVPGHDGPGATLRNGVADLWPLLGDLSERRVYFHISAPWTALSFWMVSLESS